MSTSTSRAAPSSAPAYPVFSVAWSTSPHHCTLRLYPSGLASRCARVNEYSAARRSGDGTGTGGGLVARKGGGGVAMFRELLGDLENQNIGAGMTIPHGGGRIAGLGGGGASGEWLIVDATFLVADPCCYVLPLSGSVYTLDTSLMEGLRANGAGTKYGVRVTDSMRVVNSMPKPC